MEGGVKKKGSVYKLRVDLALGTISHVYSGATRSVWSFELR